MKKIDVTDKVSFENNDDEYLPITKCVCGKKFDAWDFIIDVYGCMPTKCAECGAKLFFSNEIKVYQVVDDD